MILDRNLIPYREIVEQELEPIVWDIEPLISRGDRVIVFGEFGSFKSFIMLHMALHLGGGSTWLNTFRVPESRRVLYVDEEMNERTLRRRTKRLGRGSGILEAPGLTFLSRAGVRFDGYGAGMLMSYLKERKFLPQVIIVEALRRVLIGDENEASDVAAFWRNLEPISRLGVTVIITHHMNKPPQQGHRSNRYRASGSTDILAGSDASFSVQRVNDDTSCITGIKSRDDVELKPFYVRLDDQGDRQGPVTLTPVQPEPERREPLPEVEDVFQRRLQAS